MLLSVSVGAYQEGWTERKICPERDSRALESLLVACVPLGNRLGKEPQAQHIAGTQGRRTSGPSESCPSPYPHGSHDDLSASSGSAGASSKGHGWHPDVSWAVCLRVLTRYYERSPHLSLFWLHQTVCRLNFLEHPAHHSTMSRL